MKYVYLLRSLSFSNQRYVGLTGNLKKRLLEHNSGKASHTSKFAPWKIVAAVYFEDDLRAIEFEKYLKSGSGHPIPYAGNLNAAKVFILLLNPACKLLTIRSSP